MTTLSNQNINLTVRDSESYDNRLKFVLDLITFNEVPLVVGSYSYTSFFYPSDVDTFEQVAISLSATEAAKFYEEQFKIIFQKLMVNSTKIFINDFKAGEDGVLRSLYKDPALSIDNVKTKQILNRLLPVPDFNKLYSIKHENIFKDELKRYAALRWNVEEVLLGKKNLISGGTILLREALSQPATIKLDVITWIKDRFQSIEVLYNLSYSTESNPNQTNDISSTQPSNNTSSDQPSKNANIQSFYPLGDYTQSLLQDIEKYSSSEFYAPLKVAKRMWSLSRITNCGDLLSALTPLMQSDVSVFNQIKSEIEILTDVLEMKPAIFNTLTLLNQKFISVQFKDKLALNSITDKLFTQMLNFSKRLSNHLSYDIYNDLKSVFTEIFNQWAIYNSSGKFNDKVIKDLLNRIDSVIKKEIIAESAKYLQDIDNLNIQCKNFQF